MEVVPFEIAKKLKEKGFPQDTEKHNAWYATEYYKNSCLGEYFEGELTNTDEYGDKINALHIVETENKGAVAPTISQVLKWLREECGIFIIVEPDILSPGYKLTFTPRVKFYIKGEEDEGFSEYLTYRRDSHELAALAGIEYCLDNLI